MLIVYHEVIVDKNEGKLQDVIMAKIAAIEEQLVHAKEEIASLTHQLTETQVKLETEKVDKTEFAVQTTDFLQMINNTTMDIQGDIVELTMNVTTLTHNIHHVNSTLATKADQDDLHQLTEKLSTIEASAIGVRKREFEELSSVVHTLKTQKVNKTSFDELSSNVNRLTKSDKQQNEQFDGIQRTLEEHKSSVQQKVSRITARLDGVDGDTSENTYQINGFKSSFEDLKRDITEECDDSCKPSIKDVWHNTFG